MRTNTPRMPVLKEEELSQEQREYIETWGMGTGILRAGVIGSLLRNVQASKAFRDWSQYTMMGTTKLPVREREIVALRTAWDIKAGYVWSRHIAYATGADMSHEEIEALKRPIAERDWSAADIALIRMTDALTADFFIPDDVWAELKLHFDEVQIIDAIFVCGHFCMLGMFLNTAGVPIDEGIPSDPDLVKLS